jgi:molybdopterin adenylyltransferase
MRPHSPRDSCGALLGPRPSRSGQLFSDEPLAAIRTAVLTVSTSVAAHRAEDKSGPALAALAEEAGCSVEAMEVIPDDYALIEDRLYHYVSEGYDLIFTTGGTGMTPDDVTPEATRTVIDREAPGVAEALRAEGARHTPMAMLARGVAGIAVKTLIVNFPGSPRAVRQSWPVVEPTLQHAAETLERV